MASLFNRHSNSHDKTRIRRSSDTNINGGHKKDRQDSHGSQADKRQSQNQSRNSETKPGTSYSKFMRQYKYDKDKIHKKNGLVSYVTAVQKKQMPIRRSLYFYTKPTSADVLHASDWEMSEKFETLKNLRFLGRYAFTRCIDWFESGTEYIVSYEHVHGEDYLNRFTKEIGISQDSSASKSSGRSRHRIREAAKHLKSARGLSPDDDQEVPPGPFTELQLRTLIQLILQSIKFLHERGVVHNALWCVWRCTSLAKTSFTNGVKWHHGWSKRLSNFQYTTELIKIPEWDYAMKIKANDDTNLHYVSQSHMFHNRRPLCSFAPEELQIVLRELENRNDNKTGFGRPVDIWALGVSFYYIVTGKLPFQDNANDKLDHISDVLARCESDSIESHRDGWERVSGYAKSLCSQMLQPDPSTRLTAEQALDHEWFTVAEHKLNRQLGGELYDLSEHHRLR